MSERKCIRCLLRELAEKDYENIKKYIDIISPSERADDDLYEKRLSICKECDKLFDGTCNACGCYVEIRAASERSSCPKKKW
ncbi:MAG: DUF6171 family protein [Lachnospiraceae bacterium]|nr:DUF6171 family protein [Lachnospiraceae bacterium]